MVTYLYASVVRVWESLDSQRRGEPPLREVETASLKPIGFGEKTTHLGEYWCRPECPTPVYRLTIDWAGDGRPTDRLTVDQLLAMAKSHVAGVSVERLRAPARWTSPGELSAGRRKPLAPVTRDLPGQRRFSWD